MGFALRARDAELPMLPTRPLVFLTPLLASGLRREGLPRILPTLILPWPLPLFSLEGVLGFIAPGAVFSASLSPYVVQVEVMVVLVVVILTARRSRSFKTGDRDVVLRAIWRRWNSSSVSPS